jgi:hypothetical protein
MKMYSWQDYYIAVLAETDAKEQCRLVYQAVAAIEQRRLSPVEPDSREHDALRRAEKALRIIKRHLSIEVKIIEYWRVVVSYNDGTESAHKVFKDKARAEKFAKRQARSKVVKACRLEPFTRDLGEWPKRKK